MSNPGGLCGLRPTQEPIQMHQRYCRWKDKHDRTLAPFGPCAHRFQECPEETDGACLRAEFLYIIELLGNPLVGPIHQSSVGNKVMFLLKFKWLQTGMTEGLSSVFYHFRKAQTVTIKPALVDMSSSPSAVALIRALSSRLILAC